VVTGRAICPYLLLASYYHTLVAQALTTSTARLCIVTVRYYGGLPCAQYGLLTIGYPCRPSYHIDVWFLKPLDYYMGPLAINAHRRVGDFNCRVFPKPSAIQIITDGPS